jgi:hypothetical protein
VDNVDDILRRTRVLLVPSLWAEARSRIVVEAMLRGVPVIASNIGGIPEAKLGVDYLLPVRPIERYQSQVDEQMVPLADVPAQDIGPWQRRSRGCFRIARIMTNFRGPRARRRWPRPRALSVDRSRRCWNRWPPSQEPAATATATIHGEPAGPALPGSAQTAGVAAAQDLRRRQPRRARCGCSASACRRRRGGIPGLGGAAAAHRSRWCPCARRAAGRYGRHWWRRWRCHPAYLDEPFAFFGHSMGAVVAFELARLLRRRNQPLPRMLVASGARAPQFRRGHVPPPEPGEAEFVEALRRLEGTPPKCSTIPLSCN